MADLIEDRFDKDRADTTFDTFVQDMLNLAFQEIASEVPHARWKMDEVSLTATVAGTQYIVMPTDMDIDSLISIRDETGNKKVRRISPRDADEIDPGRDLTGDEILWWYQRVETTPPTAEDRIYFLNRPDSVDTLKIIFGIVGTTVSPGGTLILPEKYEWILIEGAMSKCWDRVDAENIVSKQLCEKNFRRGIEIIRKDANTSPGEAMVLASHRFRAGYSIQGASFPSQFDITA